MSKKYSVLAICWLLAMIKSAPCDEVTECVYTFSVSNVQQRCVAELPAETQKLLTEVENTAVAADERSRTLQTSMEELSGLKGKVATIDLKVLRLESDLLREVLESREVFEPGDEYVNDILDRMETVRVDVDRLKVYMDNEEMKLNTVEHMLADQSNQLAMMEMQQSAYREESVTTGNTIRAEIDRLNQRTASWRQEKSRQQRQLENLRNKFMSAQIQATVNHAELAKQINQCVMKRMCITAILLFLIAKNRSF